MDKPSNQVKTTRWKTYVTETKYMQWEDYIEVDTWWAKKSRATEDNLA